MRITRVKIENYKQLNLEMNFEPNMNKFDPSDNYFNIGQKYVPKAIGISGRNAIGKSNLIEVFNLIKFYTYDRNNIALFANEIMDDEKISNSVLDYGSKTHHIAPKIMKNINLLMAYVSDVENNNKQKDEIYDGIIKKYWIEMKKIYAKVYQDSSTDSQKPIVFQIGFFDKEYQSGEIIFLISDEGVKLGVKLDKQDSNLQSSEIIFSKFQNSIFISNTTRFKLSPIETDKEAQLNIGAHTNDRIMIENVLRNRFLTQKDENFKNAIKAMDSNIEDIFYDDVKKRFRIIVNGKELSWQNMSTGTLKFIEIFHDISKIKDGIYFIDELENHLNIKITNFIKTFIYKKNSIQMIFTSHSGLTLSLLMDNKQLFIFDSNFNFENNSKETIARKVSSFMNKNNSFKKKFDHGRIAHYENTNILASLIESYIDGEND